MPKLAAADRWFSRKVRARLDLPGLEAARIALSRVLVAQVHAVLGTPTRQTFPAAPFCPPGFELFDIRDGSTVRITTNSCDALALADRVLGGPWPATGAIPGPLDPLAEGALAYLLARALAVFDGPFKLTEMLPHERASSPETGEWVRAPVRLDVDGAPVSIDLWLRESSLGRVEPPPDLTFAAGMPVRVSALLGEARLALATVTRIAPSDVVLCDWCSAAPAPDGLHGTAELRWGTQALSGVSLRCDGDRLEIVMSDEPKTTTRISTTTLTPGETDLTERALSIAADAPVVLQLELARFTLTLRELAQLRPGDVLSAHAPVGAEVSLRVGDRTIARGELVDVAGEIGVRVSQLG